MNRIALPGLIAQLLQDGVAVARAEIRLGKARVTSRLVAARTGLILLVIAGIVALLSLIGLVVGLVMALAEVVNPALAGLIVMAVGLAIAGVFGWLGARRLSGRPVPAPDAHPALDAPRALEAKR